MPVFEHRRPAAGYRVAVVVVVVVVVAAVVV
jgi:hypothetical protein